MLDPKLWIEKKKRKTLEQQGNGDLRFGAGKRRPQTEMRTTAKGEMAGVGPLDIEAVRLRAAPRVLPGLEERNGDRLAHLRLFAPNLDPVQRYPAGLRHRR